jgi:hypothetical protein
MAIEMKQIEGEIGETVAAALSDVILLVADMRRTLFVRDGNLTVEHQLIAKGCDVVEWSAEQLASVIAIAAEKPENALPVHHGDEAVAVMFESHGAS